MEDATSQTHQPSEVANRPQRPPYERWEDLLPVAGTVAEDDPYAGLSARQLDDLAMLARMLRLLRAGKADSGGSMARNAERLREAFALDGLDADWLLSQREIVRQTRIRRSVNPEVDGQAVKLAGIVAPLSWEGETGVSEFLLTASIGRCSHMPAPPYNQVAQVHTDEPIDVAALIQEQGTPDPWVWVEGTIQYAASSHRVFRGDGVVRIESAYSIEPLRIVPVGAAELARRAEQARQEAEAILFPRLTDLVAGS